MPEFSVLTVNIEGDNHLPEIKKLVLDKNPDVVCVQEIFSDDMNYFQEILHVRGVFVPLCRIEIPNTVRLPTRGEWGLAIFSRLPVSSLFIHPYQGTLNHVPIYINGEPNSTNRAIVIAKLDIEGKPAYVATTHFTWTDKGAVTDLQHQHLEKVLSIMKQYEPVVFCGDFNAPRGKAIFDRLASVYVDNVPKNIQTTIDQNLHRKLGIQFVVDGMFTSSQLRASHVEVIDGVSDHMAIFAKIIL